MNITWNAQTIGWFVDASAYTGYVAQMAALLREILPQNSTLCDLGCGIAQVDFALSDHLSQITCVDLAPEVIEWIDARKRENMQVVCGDAGGISGEWDSVMALFYGGNDILRFFPLAEKQLVFTAFQQKKGGFGPQNRKVDKCISAEEMAQQLRAQGIAYTALPQSIEYGQPFRKKEDAADFVRAYTKGITEDELQAYLKDNLTEISQGEFAYYLPKKREFTLFIVRREENDQLS